MHLKKLACSGFKSFADPLEFVFDPGMTAIVGPNGCGKSNVVDAFRWVLGERSAKGLRGKEMLDVIFKGTSKRAPLSRAEVTLTFDNTDGTLPLEYTDVEVTRRLYRSGESEYLINQKKVRLKDVLALVSGTGIGTEGYSVLEQGSVDMFLHSNPAERRAVFEEAAGISVYKKQRTKALNQLDRVEGNLARLGDVVTEVERRIRSVKIQATKAQRYIEDRDRFERLKTVVSAWELARFRAEREMITYRLVEVQSRRTIVSEIVETLEEDRESHRRSLERVTEALAALREREMEARMALDRIEQRRQHIDERRGEMEQARGGREAQRNEIAQSIAEYEGRRAQVRDRLRNELESLRATRERVDEGEAERIAAHDEKVALADSIRDTKEEALQKTFAHTRLSNERTSLESELRGLEARSERRRHELVEFGEEITRVEFESGNISEQIELLRTEEREARDDAAVLSSEIERRTGLLSSNQREVSEVRGDVESKRARLRVLEELELSQEGVGKGAQELLHTDHPVGRDVVGLLASGIDADPEVAPLVDAVLGHLAESVVFWSDAPLDARARIVATLLDGQGATICQTGRPAVPVGGRGEIPSGCRRLTDQLRCDPSHRKLVEELLGEVLCAPNLHQAIELAHRAGNQYRFVTPDGCVVEKWGAVTFPSSEAGGLVSRRSEIHHLVDDLDEREAGLANLQEAGQELEVGIQARRVRLEQATETFQRRQLERESLERRLEELGSERKRLSDRVEVIEHELAEIDGSREAVAERLEIVEVELESTDEERLRLQSAVDESEAALEVLDARLHDVARRVAHLRVTATQNEERLTAARREERQLVGEIEERRERVVFLDSEDGRDEDRIAAYDVEERALTEEEAELTKNLESLAEESTEVSERANELRSALSQVERLQGEVRVEDDRLRNARETDLIRENEIRVRMDSIRTTLREELELELTDVPIDEWTTELRAEVEDEADDAFEKRLVKEAEELQKRLRKNSNVNLEAVEELGELEERNQNLTDQIEDLTNSRDGLIDVVDELNQQCRDMFAECFERVRGYFSQLFTKIFGGGSADLTLEEDVDILEAGVNVVASPPGKRINSLQLMSGGEKALTAVAVLFALFKTRPSPFCLL
ncbi:MAG: chromosome segregation protein SMC, partial [Planctomycetota bacterium]